ncbi:MAG: acyl-ACP--UDP-N-acetylglucosamine O-acyltransferase [Salibacteraceae bacterium]|jgi:UDP-N-acetylglucosamine acyltransferase|nr:acyl-ACP--UDP-N-acetylglucosamine O-acyltransferase [Salibacteraceae bacterium]MDP4687607.1 acyl-ACP--UDP-N-acetylglucosamine O-acyltransferase [Salibacteraceae bacterium]MDP4762882.1 acyl-ACP--UDP-N-acetylglucosamine O-acyltransferase [Salibacteraceae bacterium]MDP4934645.1 acyl-ACP--UDP-N-acetylglucosamine O-acyltransferase [Salibacteraceae bacterium]MDP4963546.1 acyl-ACP--UDP-N-acetylglucosamine O-acyltransferase [Salibacteraceae bacterium]
MSELRANIHPKAKLGANVVVEPFSTVYDDVEIGDGTWIGPNVTIMNGARIGKNCKIFPGAVISADPQDLKYAGEDTKTIIGDNTVIRECVTINKGTSDRWSTEVGANCLLMAYVHVAHDCKIGNNVILANCVNLAGHITINDFAILEGMVAVQQFLTIGAHSFIAGGSLVRKNVPPYVKAAREPLSYVGINSIGLKRRGFSDETVLEIESIYRTLYVRNVNTAKALAEIKDSFAQSVTKDEIVAFIEASEKGIMRGAN